MLTKPPPGDLPCGSDRPAITLSGDEVKELFVCLTYHVPAELRFHWFLQHSSRGLDILRGTFQTLSPLTRSSTTTRSKPYFWLRVAWLLTICFVAWLHWNNHGTSLSPKLMKVAAALYHPKPSLLPLQFPNTPSRGMLPRTLPSSRDCRSIAVLVIRLTICCGTGLFQAFKTSEHSADIWWIPIRHSRRFWK